MICIAFLVLGFLYFRIVSAPREFEGIIIAKHVLRAESMYGGGLRGYVVVKLQSGETFPVNLPPHLFHDARVGMVLRRAGPQANFDLFDPPRGGELVAQ